MLDDKDARMTLSPVAPRIHAVVVVHRRYERLAAALESIERQSVPVERIVVVDNTPAGERKTLPTRHATTWLNNDRNLGGAGGYAMGILSALGAGADHLLLIDDDGTLVGDDFLKDGLAELAVTGADLVAPLPVDETDPAELCFPYGTGKGRTYKVAEMERIGRVRGFAHLFNGCFAPAATFLRYGLPDLSLYLRGDEVDYLQRVLKAGGLVVTSPAMKVTHPSGKPETHKVLGNWLMAIDPDSAAKR
jgi:rhamnopyranosyl-N-acetylglucosaminyl-diphospho-decaprenol beta-1,3/1,4-galactofuranosyltransferase